MPRAILSIQSNPNETAKAYLIEREEKLSQCFACVLVDGAHAAPERSLRLAPELLTRCVAFLNRVRRFAPGFERAEGGPQAALADFLLGVERRARSLPAAKREDAECALVPLVPGGDTVVEQLSALWTGSRPDRAWVLSPFFDDDQHAGATAAAFAGLLTTRGDR